MDHELSLQANTVQIESTEDRTSDAELARLIANGDVDAWDRFFDRFSKWAYRFAYYHLDRNHADAEDLCSDILMAAAKGIHGYIASRGGLDSWMLGLARHRLAKFCRSRHRNLLLIPDDSNADLCADRFDDLADQVFTKDAVNKALATLSERQASVLVGKYIEGRSTEELARIEKTTPKAIESLLMRARSSFRRLLLDFVNSEERGRE